MSVRVEEGDCREVIPRLVAEGVVADAICCDPPYHLLPTVKRFQATTIGGNSDVERRAKARNDGLGRLAGGFMGQSWDGGDVAFRPETWATVATLLRPGGFLLAFGGTRTYHRLVCAIEDAGFVVQDAIGWLYGSGFPKRRDMLKPAMELICVAYKPGGKRTLQVDECRISWEYDSNNAATNPLYRKINGYKNLGGTDENSVNYQFRHERLERNVALAGRWPANVCHDGSDEVMEAFAAFGERPAGGNVHAARQHSGGVFGGGRIGAENVPKDFGTAARYFYCAKAGAEDRFGSRHPTVKPVELLKWLVPLVTPRGGTVLDPFAGSGTTGVAALATGRNAILIEREAAYVADIRARLAHYEGEGRHSLAVKARNRAAAEPLPLFEGKP